MAIKMPKAFRSPTGRLILAITVTDLFDSTTKFMGRWGPEAGLDSFLCAYQTWSITQFNASSVLLGMFMGLNAMYLIYFNGTVEKIQKYEYVMICISFILPLPFSLTTLLIKPNGMNMYGDVTLWCWITAENGIYRIVLWFLLLWIVTLVNITSMTLTIYKIRKSEAFNSLVMHSSDSQKKSTFGSLIIKRMLAYLVAFFIVWTPSSVNRVYGLFGGQSYYLDLLQSICSPSRGFINFLVFFCSW